MLDYRTHTFLAACRLGSFTRAAEELHITQPAVSQHIRQLEAHYGCPLFRKTGRGIEPTEAGLLLNRALAVIENDEARIGAEVRAAAASAGRATLPLRFGCTRTIADFVAPKLVAHHLEQHPDERILMRSGNTRELVEAIQAGELDFALVEGSFDRSVFAFEAFSRERYIAVAAPQVADGMPTPARPRSIIDLLGYTLILRESGSGTREILEKHLAARDLAVRDFAAAHEVGSIPALKACVQAGAGISFLYRIAVERELGTGELVDITPADFTLEHDFSLIWQRGSRYGDRYRRLLPERGPGLLSKPGPRSGRQA